MAGAWLSAAIRSFCGQGLVLGTMFLAASMTPSLVPRGAAIQGILSGACLAAGYGVGVAIRAGWLALQLPVLTGRRRQWGLVVAVGVSAWITGVAMWQAARWQDRLRALMEMPRIEASAPATVFGVTLALFLVLLLLARVIRWTWWRISAWLGRFLPQPQAALIGLLATAMLCWWVGKRVVVSNAMRAFDNFYAQRDARFEEGSPRPTDPMKTGGPGSLLRWEGLGRTGRAMIAGAPDAAMIREMTGGPGMEPIRVYAGLNSADTPAERAALVLAELIRVGGF